MHDFVTVWYLLNREAVSLSRVPIKVIPDQGKGLVKALQTFVLLLIQVIKRIM